MKLRVKVHKTQREEKRIAEKMRKLLNLHPEYTWNFVMAGDEVMGDEVMKVTSVDKGTITVQRGR